MQDYHQLYYLLFNKITDALEALEHQNYGTARNLLIQAQQEAEEQFIAHDDSNE